MGGSKEQEARLFPVAPTDRKRGSGHKLKYMNNRPQEEGKGGGEMAGPEPNLFYEPNCLPHDLKNWKGPF